MGFISRSFSVTWRGGDSVAYLRHANEVGCFVPAVETAGYQCWTPNGVLVPIQPMPNGDLEKWGDWA